jgi:hypothetical protein
MDRGDHSVCFGIIMAKLTEGGLWLAKERRALGLTSDALGDVVEFAGETIRAVESGARPLTPRLQARAEAYFAKARLGQIAKARRGPHAPESNRASDKGE